MAVVSFKITFFLVIRTYAVNPHEEMSGGHFLVLARTHHIFFVMFVFGTDVVGSNHKN